MWDKRRLVVNDLAEIDYLIVHHSAGDPMRNAPDDEVKNFLNGIGFERGYKPYGYDFATGYSQKFGQNLHKLPDGGGISYCEYHYCIHPYDADGNEYGYRLIQLLDDPMRQDSASIGLRFQGEEAAAMQKRAIYYNSRSIAICFMGNYEIDEAPDKMIDFFVSLFGKQKPLSWILSKNPMIRFIGHKDTLDATSCPGKNLHEYVPIMQKRIYSLTTI
jgi:hypothetical protein